MCKRRLATGAAVLSFLVLCTEAAWAQPPITLDVGAWGHTVLYKEDVRQRYWPITGRGLPEIFAGVPEAEEAAQQYGRLAVRGNGASFLGTTILLGATWYRVNKGYARTEHPPSMAVWLSGGALSLAGSYTALQARRHLYRAVSIFNADHEVALRPSFGPIADATPGQRGGRLELEWQIGIRK